GDDARIGSSGYNAQIGSSGYNAQIGSSGYNARIGSSGDDARIGSSGNDARIDATGKNAVVAAAGSVRRIVLGEGGCVVIPYHDGTRTRFAVAYVGENDIKANTPYTLNENGQFEEIEE
ncbi:protein YdhT, partial [Serratia sp. IR-2025]